MGSLMESKLTARQHALVGTVLKAQTASLGRARQKNLPGSERFP